MNAMLLEALKFFVTVFAELAVLFIAISLFVAWLNQKLPAEKVQNLLNGNSGYAVAVGLGAATPFCSCSTLPMAIGLIKARASFGPIMAFLITSPLINPFIIGLFWVTFGIKTTLIYSTLVIALAMVSGFLLSRFKFERFIKSELTRCGSPEVNQSDNSHSNTQKIKPKYSLLKETLNQFISFSPYMVLGVMVGAVLHGFVPESFFNSVAFLTDWWLIPLAAIVGVFLYVRASTMIPIASSLIAKGMSIGAVMSLTIAGAGASLPEMIMMKKMFRWPLLISFIFVVFLTACLTGFAINTL